MDRSIVQSVATRLLFVSLAVGTPLVSSARAGDHHPTVYYLPVETTAAPVVAVAAPAQVVTLQPKHGHRVVYQLAPVQSLQLVQSSPVQTIPLMQVAPAQSLMMTLVPAPVAAGPANPPSFTFNGVTYVPKGSGTPTVATPPDSGDLSAAKRTDLLAQLSPFVVKCKALGVSDTLVRASVREKAKSLYEEAIGGAADTDAKNKAVDSLTNEALGSVAVVSESTRSISNGPQQPMTIMMVPAAGAPAPVQYFLPVKVKHHSVNPFQ